MITLRQMEAFRAVMLTRSMTDAGRILSVTQSAISKIMRELEQEIGFPLFSRRKGGLEPSPEALALFEEVQRSFTGLDKIARAAERIRLREGGRLRIAAMPALTSGFLQRVVRAFVDSGHQIEISVDTYNSPEVVDLVGAGHYDLGFAMTPIDSDRVVTGPVMRSLCVCLLPPRHRLARKRRIRLLDLEGETFISLAETTTTRLKIDGMFGAANVSRVAGFEARWSISVAAFVAQGLGCAIIEPFSARISEAQGVLVRPLVEEIDFSFVEVLPSHSTASAFSRDFMSCFREELAILQGMA